MCFIKLIRLLITVLMLSSCIQASKYHLKSEEEISKFRKTLSHDIRKYMNESADPCENFYEFSCGKWKQYHPAKGTYFYSSMRTNVYYSFQSEMIKFLTKIEKNDTVADRKVKTFYSTCSKKNFAKQDDQADILKEIIGEFGQMPALDDDNWMEDDFDWLKTVAEISNKYGIHIIIGFDIDTTSRQANDLYMKSKLNTTNLEAEIEKASNIFQGYLFLNKSASLEIANEISNFEHTLWNITWEDAGTELLSFESFLKEYSNDTDIIKFVNTTFGYTPQDIIMLEPRYTKALADIKTNFPKKVVANYIFYKLISEFIELFNSDCYSLMEKYFFNILSNMYYRISPNNIVENDWQLMWQSIKITLQEILESKRLNWLDDDSIEYFLEKIHSMQMKVATFKDDNFDEVYATLAISESNYIENMKSLKNFMAKKTRNLINVIPRPIEDVLLYSPVYMYASNTVIIPVSNFAMDFYGSDMLPNAINYARMGLTLTHELLHGLSGGGQYYNKLGYLLSYYKEDIEDEFQKRVQCFYNQYHNFTFAGQPLHQDESQSENAADNGGVILAYEDYLRWYSDNDRTLQDRDMEILPNLDYTHKQLYFITYAQSCCASMSEDVIPLLVLDTHSPDEFRAYVPLSNYREFSKEFNCPKGSAMNPKKKCSLY